MNDDTFKIISSFSLWQTAMRLFPCEQFPQIWNNFVSLCSKDWPQTHYPVLPSRMLVWLEISTNRKVFLKDKYYPLAVVGIFMF